MKKRRIFFSFLCLLMLSLTAGVFTACSKESFVTFVYHVDEKVLEEVVKEDVLNVELFQPEKEGYVFDGWYLDENLELKLNLTEIKKGSCVNLYPKWAEKEISTVIFNYCIDGSVLTEIVEFDGLEEYEFYSPKKPGLNFEGWYVDEDLETILSLSEVNKGNTINLYPKWSKEDVKTIDIIYHFDHHIVTETVELAKLQEMLLNPTKEDYLFDGWYLDEKLNNKLYVEEVDAGSSLNLFAKWTFDGEYKVTILALDSNAITFEGQTTQTITKDNLEFNDVKVVANLGYKFKYYEINDVKYYSDNISLSQVTEDTEIKVVSDYATYELPIINIDTFGQSINSKAEYTTMNFSIENCEDELVDVAGGIRLRGNSSFYFVKKPYRIKFDKKQSLFGLDKAKSWVLLADYIDPSTLDNYVALTLGTRLDNLRFTPTPHKINLYLNGRFDGLYTLCEQVQENEGRLDIEIEITEDMTELKDFNFLVGMENGAQYDPTLTAEEDYFYLSDYDRYIELKYPEKEDFVSEAQFQSFFSQLKDYMQYIFDIFSDQDQEKIEAETNIDSLVDFSLVDNIMLEFDHMHKSFNMFYTNTSDNDKENHKLNFGPIWDYDSAGGKPWTGEPNESYNLSNSVKYSNLFFAVLRDIPDFHAKLKSRYKNVVAKILSDVIVEMYEVEMGMRESLELNHKRWYTDCYDDITKDNLEFLNRILVHRKQVLDKYLAQ